jgi:TnpA family transposase
MPVDFLSDEQARAYAQYPADVSDIELARYFYLDSADGRILMGRRGDHNRLGMALHLCALRYLGTFLPDLRATPARVITYVARQLQISDPVACLQRYHASQMRFDHMDALAATLGYRPFTDARATFPLARRLYLRAWTSQDRPSALFEHAVAWLRQNKVLLPGVTTLTRFVARVRERVASHLWRALCRDVTPQLRDNLEAILTRPAHDLGPRLETLRRGETRLSAPALLRAFDRFEAARSVGVSALDLSHVPVHRLRTLATHVITSRAAAIRDLAPERRLATLLAFVRSTEVAATDDALDILDGVIDTLIRNASKTRRQKRLRTLGDLDEAALSLADHKATLLQHSEWSGEEVIAFLEAHRSALSDEVARILALARRTGDEYQEELRAAYAAVRRFVPRLLSTVTFASTSAAAPLLHARDFLLSLEGQRPSAIKQRLERAPLAFVPASWRRYVHPVGQAVDRPMYTLCFLSQLQTALRTREVFAPSSSRWSDPRASLLQAQEWERARPAVCALLQRSPIAATELDAWADELDTLYRRVGCDLPEAVRIESVTDPHTHKTTERLSVAGLEAQPEPPSLLRLREQIARRMPFVDLSAVLMEIEARTAMALEFTHIGGSDSRLDDFPVSLCAALLTQACNLPVSEVAQEHIPALAADRIIYVLHNYVRPETISRANPRLIQFHLQIPLATVLGGGEVASADGLRFVVPVRSVNAGPNSKYFGVARGVTLINYTLNHFFGFNGAVVTGTLRDSLFVLDGLLEQESPLLRPQEIMTDTASYSDVVFGLFSLLGYRFSPRLADLGDVRFWRFDPHADYGALNHVTRHRLDRHLIEEQWDDILRVVGSLKYGRLRASDVIRMLQGEGRPTRLGRAIGEVGRIAKSFYLVAYLADETYRRRIQIQLNRGESRHSLARDVFHGRRGELRQAYREGQEEQLGALGLVVNMLVIWNTLYQDRILSELRARGATANLDDIERLSPLGYDHIRIHGQYVFTLAEPIQHGGFLPLRTWEEVERTEGVSLAP